jgi:hypothetical protein
MPLRELFLLQIIESKALKNDVPIGCVIGIMRLFIYIASNNIVIGKLLILKYKLIFYSQEITFIGG